MLRSALRFLLYVACVLAVSVVSAPTANAYIDPGSTNFIIQILVGAAAGAGLAIATFWARIRRFFGRVFGRRAPERSDPQ